MMKHVTLFLCIVALAALSSCRKERDCRCTFTTTNNSNGTSSSVNNTETSGKMTRKDAKDWCESYESNSTLGNYTFNTTCELD